MKAVIYVRVSTIEQNSDRQILDLKNYADKLQLNVTKIFTDTISGYRKSFNDREQFNIMMEYVEKHKIQNILVSELSRISRQYIHTVNFIQNCSEKLINIHIHKENLKTLNEDGSINMMVQMLVGLLSSIASQESSTLSYRIKSGKRSEALKGKSYNGQLYGYDNVDGYPVINEEAAKNIIKMFDMLLQGMGCRKIANYLNTYGDGKRNWSSASVHSVVTNPFLMGKRRFKEIIIPVDPIVSEEVFNEAQTFIKSRFRFVGESKHTNPFASFIFCECGETFTQIINLHARTNLYKCSNPSCSIASINRIYLISQVKALLENNAKLTQDKKKRSNFNFQIKVNNASIESNRKRLSKIKDMSDKTFDLYANEKISESQFDRASNRYENESIKLNEEISKLNNTNKAIGINLENEISHYSDNLEIFKNQLLPILDQIVIGKTHCTIHLKDYSMMYFYILRGNELQLYNNHLKKFGKNVEFKMLVKSNKLDSNMQMLIDNHLEEFQY